MNTTLIAMLATMALAPIMLAAVFLIRKMAAQNIRFTTLAPNTGKIIVKEENVVNVLFNTEKFHYDKTGKYTEGKQKFGFLFDFLGVIHLGSSLIYKPYKWDMSWDELSMRQLSPEEKAEGKTPSYELVSKTECGCTIFKSHYSHSLKIVGAEMAREGTGTGNGNTSTTKIDAGIVAKVKINNIVGALFTLLPQGITFVLVTDAIQGAFNDYVTNKTWLEFRKEPKLAQNSDFVKYIIENANNFLSKTLAGVMEIESIELLYHDLTKSAENVELEKSQVLVQIAGNRSAARVIDAGADSGYYAALAKVIGQEAAGQMAVIAEVAKTKLLAYNSNAMPLITSDGGNNNSTKKGGQNE